MKPNNLLIRADGILKIADFGIAKGNTDPKHTVQISSRAYRAPELLFGQSKYGDEVDMWSLGVVFGELLARKHLFESDSDIQQIVAVFTLLGTPKKEDWKSVAALDTYLEFQHMDPTPWKEVIGHELDSNTQELLSSLLFLDPERRASARQALSTPYFESAPPPTPPADLPKPLPQRSGQ